MKNLTLISIVLVVCAFASSYLFAVPGVGGGNTCPTATPISITVDQNGTVSFQLMGTDPDGDPLTFLITSPSLHGVVVLQTQTGAGSYTPAAGYCGPDSFMFAVSDGLCQSLPALVTVTVNCTNQCPTADPASLSVDEGGQVNSQLTGSDPDGDPLTFLLTGAPAHGTVVLQTQSGAVTYTPSAGYCGPDSFTFTVSDAICQSASATVSISVTCNQCPTADPLSVSVNEGGTVNFQLTGSDPDGDPLTFLITSAPSHGVVVVQTQSGAATYSPSAGYCGPDSFMFVVTDGQCQSTAATVSIAVNCALMVGVDIKPGSNPNSFKCGSSGVLPVAILGSATFNVASINTTSIKLEASGGTINVLPTGIKIADVNGDHRPDLVVRFDSLAVASVIGCPLPQNTVVPVTIKGMLTGGQPFKGTDTLRIAH